jgi:AAA domain
VPALFPKAEKRKGKVGGYRVSSESLGRRLQEDIGIAPNGINDFGPADRKDPREGSRSPIDLVMIALRHRADPLQFQITADWFFPNEKQPYSKKELFKAIEWLCGKLGREVPDTQAFNDAEYEAMLASISIASEQFDLSSLEDAAEAADADRDELPDDDVEPNKPGQSGPRIKTRSEIDADLEYSVAQSELRNAEWRANAAALHKAYTAEHPIPDDQYKSKENRAVVTATPFEWIDPQRIPQRHWLYKPHYIRKFVSLTIAPSGLGKTSLMIAETMAMVTGKPLLGITPAKKLRVWYWNGEDPMDELQRRFAAAIKHYELTKDDIGDRLFLDSGLIMPIVIAEDTKTGTKIAVPTIKDVIETLRENKIDVLMIDPFISSHNVNENDNNAIDRVAKIWTKVSGVADCATGLAHHSRKTMMGGDGSVSVDDSRGASALIAAARAKRALNHMSAVEAKNADIEENKRKYYYRADAGNENLIPPAEHAQWFKLTSVDLCNNEIGWGGDEIGVATKWFYPTPNLSATTVNDIRRAQDAVRTNGPWRFDKRAAKWAGLTIGQALGRDMTQNMEKKAVATLIDTWVSQGYLTTLIAAGTDRKGHVYVAAGKVPEEAF